MPCFDDVPEAFKQAVESFGMEKLDAILSAARVRDTLSLWHLLSRLREEERGIVFDRLQELVAAPEGVSVVQERHPNVEIYTPVVDRRLNEHKFIVPGLGDFGDRLYGTV